MSDIDWPENALPLPKRSLRVDNDPRLLSQKMEVGVRQRKRFSDAIESLNVTWEFNVVQWSYFKTFVESSLNNGAEPFMITLPTVEGLQRIRAIIIEGKYKESFYTGGVDISAELQIIKPVVLSEDIFYLISISPGISEGLTTYDDDFILLESRLFNSLSLF